jgi:uncharacterized repeat protein (TIGR01451 family)
VDRTVADPLSSSSGQTGPVSSSVDQPIDYSPGLAILKMVSSVTDVNGDHLVDAGDVIHYNIIHVANTGNVTLTGLTVTDPLTGNPAGVVSTLAVGHSEDLAASYTISQTDVDNHAVNAFDSTADNQITNTAKNFWSTLCKRSLSATATMSCPMSSPIVTFRNAASNASCPIMS